MIKLSRLTDYAVVVLGQLATEPGKQMTTSELSVATGIPEPTVSKVLKLLARPGVIRSTRGANGGYTLDKMPTEISVASVIAALDGPIAITACIEGSDDTCNYRSACPLQGRWQKVNDAISDALTALKIADLLGEAKKNHA